MRFHIGIDSTDSAELGMCTTYLGAVLLERLSKLPVKPISFPELVRLNPNVPWKTRGNGAVCLRYEADEELLDEIKKVSSDTIEELSVFDDPQTNPGLSILKGEVPPGVRDLYHRSLHHIIEVEDARDVGRRAEAFMRGWKNEKGMIGSLAAIGADLSDHTYEAIQYRPGRIKARKRKVDIDSLVKASLSYDGLFFNTDPEGKPVCIPHSPCPVILGLRGMDPGEALAALREVEMEDTERWVLWRTNQHTDAHIENVDDLSDVRSLSSISCRLTVSREPRYIDGGHLLIRAADGKGTRIDLAAYEPTKTFRKELAGLVPGDVLTVWGSVRNDNMPLATINLEKVRVEKLVELTTIENPRCPECGGPTTSMGKDQGLRCKKCRYRGDDLVPVERSVIRDLRTGMVEPPPDAWRHLFRPSDLPRLEEEDYDGPYWGLGIPG